MEIHLNEIVFVLTALLGGAMHYLKKYVRGETTVKIYEWYGPANAASTIYTVTVFFFAIVGALAADVINPLTGFWAAMYSGFVTGFAIDAGINSDPNLNRSVLENKRDLDELFGRGGPGRWRDRGDDGDRDRDHGGGSEREALENCDPVQPNRRLIRPVPRGS